MAHSEPLISSVEDPEGGLNLQGNTKTKKGRYGIVVGIVVALTAGVIAAVVFVSVAHGTSNAGDTGGSATPSASGPVSGFYVDPDQYRPGSLRGTWMMAVLKMPVPAPPPAPVPSGPTCCGAVRAARQALVDAELVLDRANKALNGTNKHDNELLAEADTQREEADRAMQQATAAVAAQSRALTRAISKEDNAKSEVQRIRTLCSTPAPPPDCDGKRKAAKDKLDAATAEKNEAQDEMTARQQDQSNAQSILNDAIRTKQEGAQ